MPATFQKTIDKTLDGINSKFAILDDILVITKRSLNEQENELDKILAILDKENLAINLQKCEFAKNMIEWLGFKITSQGTTPLITKTEAIMKLEHPQNIKTSTVIHGKHTSPDKIDLEISRTNRTTQNNSEKTR